MLVFLMDMLFYLLRLKYTVLFLLIAIHCGSSPSFWTGVIYINWISLLGFNVHVCGIWSSRLMCCHTSHAMSPYVIATKH